MYGFLEFHGWINDFKQGREQLLYYRERNGRSITQQLTQTEIIRHQIHHPENNLNQRFSREELRTSLEKMREYIRRRAENEGIWEPIDQKQ